MISCIELLSDVKNLRIEYVLSMTIRRSWIWAALAPAASTTLAGAGACPGSCCEAAVADCEAAIVLLVDCWLFGWVRVQTEVDKRRKADVNLDVCFPDASWAFSTVEMGIPEKH
jgi:hypothetical protein